MTRPPRPDQPGGVMPDSDRSGRPPVGASAPGPEAAAPGAPVPLIRLRGIEKRVGRKAEVAALRRVDLDVWPGECLAVMGPSGSGKSTLLAILGLLDTPTAGRYWFDGVDVAGLEEAERDRLRGRQLGFVFQSSYLIGDDSAELNTGLALRVRGVPGRARGQLVRQALDAVGLADRVHTRAKRLSGGERQRVSLARALVPGPRLLLADEPTGALDTASAAGLVAQLRAAAERGATVVVVTHDPVVAAAADRAVRLVDGTLADVSPPPAAAPRAHRPPPLAASAWSRWAAEAADAARAVIDTSARSVLLLLAYTLGVAALVGAIGLTQSASGAVAAKLLEAASTRLYVSTSSEAPMGRAGFEALLEAAAALERLDGVEGAAPHFSYAPRDVEVRRLAPGAVTHAELLRADVVVCDSRYPTRLGAEVAAGAPLTILDAIWSAGTGVPAGSGLDGAAGATGGPSGSGAAGASGLVAVLGAKAAELLGVAGAEPGTLVWVNQHAVAVTAILAPSGIESLDNALLLSPPGADLLSGTSSALILVAAAPGRAEALHRAIPLALAPANPGGVEVSTPSDLASLQAAVASNLTELMSTLGWVILALAALSAATSMLLSIHQRAPEIALRRAVGAKRLAVWRG
ncbi:MAG: ATP-binding cassette domain-containing protein, partial [Bifidobacteriaceae bacterium]|nr:ATP-binding cassette domain-containing protein [Bifidobacteriaceae bacterium]